MTFMSKSFGSQRLAFSRQLCRKTQGRPEPATSTWPSACLFSSSIDGRNDFMRLQRPLFATQSNAIKTTVSSTPRTVSAPQILRDASGEAQKLTLLLTKSSSSEQVQQAAESLLQVTHPPQALRDAMDQNVDAEIASLHRSFLSLASTCLSHPGLTEPAVQVTRRAHVLGLPFHLPLYQQLVTAIAQNAEDQPCGTILEVASWACLSLNTSLEAPFFASALTSLVGRNLLREALDLVQAMQDVHDVFEIETKVALDMLSILKEKLQAALKDPSSSTGTFDEGDATELVLMLQSAVENDLIAVEAALEEESLGETLAALAMAQSQEPDLDNDDDDGNDAAALESLMDAVLSSSSSRDADFTSTTVRDSMTDLVQRVKESQEAWAQRGEQDGGDATTTENVQTISVAVKVDQEGNVHDVIWQDPTHDQAQRQDEQYEELVHDVIYMRAADTWQLPDVTDQLIKLNDGVEVLYTPEYEDELMRRLYLEQEENDGKLPS